MRYAATIQPHPEKPPLLIGVGETQPEALAAARAWFQQELDHTSSKEWSRIYALQDQLGVASEDEFASRTGVGLDEWLARMAAAGVAPAKAPPVTAHAPLAPPTPRKPGAGGLEKLVYCGLFCALFVGSLATAKYVGGRLVDREIHTALSNSNNPIGTGPVAAPAIATIDTDDLWGGLYDPDAGGDQIDGIAGP
ncbi:MAG TPA: hypothetical protein VH482_27940 [Thermomicrobiales bacterium]|jgi:hypothetical protein